MVEQEQGISVHRAQNIRTAKVMESIAQHPNLAQTLRPTSISNTSSVTLIMAWLIPGSTMSPTALAPAVPRRIAVPLFNIVPDNSHVRL